MNSCDFLNSYTTTLLARLLARASLRPQGVVLMLSAHRVLWFYLLVSHSTCAAPAAAAVAKEPTEFIQRSLKGSHHSHHHPQSTIRLYSGKFEGLTPLQSTEKGLEFALDLEACIRNHALRLAETFPSWGNKCEAVTTKVDYQAMVYEETLSPIMQKHGYTGALWCAMYSLGMVPIVDVTQPNNPNFDVWYSQLMCPWDFPKDCGASDKELTAYEVEGQPVCPAHLQRDPAQCAPNQHPQYAIWPDDQYQQVDPLRRTMSCALCGRLKRTFPVGAPVGAPGLIQKNVGVEYSLKGVPEDQTHLFTAWWDMHAFGAWLANMAGQRRHEDMWNRETLVANINLYKASNGEEIHGYLWQSLRLLAYDSGTLHGTRETYPPHKKAVDHAHQVCAPMWWLSPQSMNDCAHAAGHVWAPGIEPNTFCPRTP